jgi:hypothetical protein
MQLHEQDERNLFLEAGEKVTHSGRGDDRAGDQPEFASDQWLRISP